MPVDKWNSQKIVRAVGGEMAKRMNRAVVILQGDVQRKLSVGQPVVRGSGGRLRGLNPSAPGEPPHVLTGRLRTSITHDVATEGNIIVGRIGTNAPYARRLELGFFGTDARGRNQNQAARPFLRPALKEGLPRMIRILTAEVR